MKPAITIGAFAFALATLPLSSAVSTAIAKPAVEVRVRARHHGLDGRSDRRRQAQDLVDRDRDCRQ